MSYQFHPAAVSEYLESIAFYESRSKGLGADFIVEFELLMERVCAAPSSFPLELQPDIRKAVLQKFPYNLLFRTNAGMVQILAVAHQRRRPGFWAGRILA